MWMLRFFVKKRVFVSRLSVVFMKMEPSGIKTMSATLNRATGEAEFVNDENRRKASPRLQRSATEGKLRLVVISFLTFLQWFLGILFFVPAERIWWSFNVRSSATDVHNKKLKTSRIFVVDSVSSCDKLLRSYRTQYPIKMNFLGLDCEWVNRKGQTNAPVALLQIATPLCDCFLIRLCKMEGRLPQTVREILKDKNVLKFGVGIQDDVKKLSEMFGVDVLGCVDLRHVVQRCRLDETDKKRDQKMSLDALAKNILGVTMDKSWRIRCSNWEAEQFNTRQIEYAMNDALVASHIFLRLVKSKTEERNVVTTAYISEDCSDLEKKGAENQNDSLRLGDNFVKDSKKESLSQLNELEAGSDKLDSIMYFPDKDFASKGHTSDCVITKEKAIITLSNENINNLESQVREDKGLSMESSNNPETSSKKSSNKSQGSFLREGDCRSCSQVSEDSFHVDAFDLECDCYEVMADLNKFESEGMLGYLFREEVVNLVQNTSFCERASSLCKGVTDLAFKNRKGKVTNKAKTKEYPSEKTDGKAYKRGTARKSPLYMNCMLAAPDGSRLCTLDRKKADWYIEKGIGFLTLLDPYTVQLKFEPSGRPGSEDSYYLNFKDNICVVCGSNQSYMRKNVVPHDYRRHFPLVMKDHHSHDILLLCPECHCLSNAYDARLRDKLANEYDAPLGNATVARLIEDPELKKVKSAAKALNYASDRLPQDRHQTLSSIVANYYNVTALTPEMIAQAAAMETRKENSSFVSHGQEVVKKVREKGKLLEFEKMWRKHFIDTMHPQYLPPLWSVDHRHVGLKEKLENGDDS